MPELPEVETIRKDLSKILIGKSIRRVFFDKPKMIHPSVKKAWQVLNKNKIILVGRRGKMLYFKLHTDYFLLIHLKMTGQLVWAKTTGKLVVGGHPIVGVKSVPNKYTHVIMEFTNGSKLFFNDMRQFGYWKVVTSEEFANISRLNFGPEPLSKEFSFDVFNSKLSRRSRAPIKAVILNQQVVAGVGNIYADESLWFARIKPSRRINELAQKERLLLFKSIKKVLQQAVKYRGTSFNSYVDSLGQEGSYWPQRKVYGRNGLACRRCGTIILKTRVAGRGTHYCPKCQR